MYVLFINISLKFARSCFIHCIYEYWVRIHSFLYNFFFFNNSWLQVLYSIETNKKYICIGKMWMKFVWVFVYFVCACLLKIENKQTIIIKSCDCITREAFFVNVPHWRNWIFFSVINKSWLTKFDKSFQGLK